MGGKDLIDQADGQLGLGAALEVDLDTRGKLDGDLAAVTPAGGPGGRRALHRQVDAHRCQLPGGCVPGMIVVRAGKPELALPVVETRSGVRLVLAKILDAKSTFLLAFKDHDELFFACWLHRIKFAGKDQGKSCTLKRVFYQRLTLGKRAI